MQWAEATTGKQWNASHTHLTIAQPVTTKHGALSTNTVGLVLKEQPLSRVLQSNLLHSHRMAAVDQTGSHITERELIYSSRNYTTNTSFTNSFHQHSVSLSLNLTLLYLQVILGGRKKKITKSCISRLKDLQVRKRAKVKYYSHCSPVVFTYMMHGNLFSYWQLESQFMSIIKEFIF